MAVFIRPVPCHAGPGVRKMCLLSRPCILLACLSIARATSSSGTVVQSPTIDAAAAWFGVADPTDLLAALAEHEIGVSLADLASLDRGEQAELGAGLSAAGVPRGKFDCHFRNKATEYDSKLGIKWLSCTAK